MRPHISINVGNVKKSVEFYKKFFGSEPQKQNADYAKFDLQSPALNFSMQTAVSGNPSRVSHFGIEVDSPLEVREWRRRLEAAGLSGKVEEETSCCYALQDKVWFKDPDGNAWEIFHVHSQLPVIGPVKASLDCCVPSEASASCAS